MNRAEIAASAAAESAGAEPRPLRRVREEVRDGLAVAGASVVASVALVLVATVLMRLV